MARVFIPGFRKIETRSSGEGGTSNYNDLENKPSINNVPLVGNLNTANLKLTDATLTEEGVPAEAKTVGTKLEEQATSLTALSEQLGNHTVKSDVPENAVFTDTVYDDTEVKESIDELNSNLSDLKVSDVAGGKNLVLNTVYGFITVDNKVNIDNSSTSYIFYAQAGKTYSFSGDATPTAQGVRFAKVSSISPETNEPVSDFNTIADGVSTFTTNETGYYMLYVYNTKTSGIKFQIEKGTTATEYEPYIPSVKMIAEEVNAQNESLDDYGLVNKANGWLQRDSSRIVTPKTSCTEGKTIRFIADYDINYFGGKVVIFYNSSGTQVDNSFSIAKQDSTFTVPSGATSFEVLMYKDEGVSASGNYPYSLYADNAIDELKNDLDKLNSLPIGTIIQLDAAKDNIETTEQKYGWQYLGTSNIECNDGSVKLLVTNVYRKNN